MFTGIITDNGIIKRIEEGTRSRRVWLKPETLDVEQTALGASVACNGCCLTVAAREDGCFVFDIGAETLEKTTLGTWVVDTAVNLEPSLRLGDELGGHMVSGHVDGLATIEEIKPDGNSWRLSIRAPDELAHFIAPKGSVALNGVSLTVNEVEGSLFGVCIIPHTWQVTNMNTLKPRDKLNLEVDMMARYVARIIGQS